jgi:hypothetical protein
MVAAAFFASYAACIAACSSAYPGRLANLPERLAVGIAGGATTTAAADEAEFDGDGSA